MVVICAGTSGYNLDVDARYLWDFQKRLQGSHFANGEQAIAFNQLVVDGEIQPCLGQVFDFEQVGDAHQLMYKGRHQPGKMVILVGADREGMGGKGRWRCLHCLTRGASFMFSVIPLWLHIVF